MIVAATFSLVALRLKQRNIKPMTRPERRALKDTVALEKSRLMQVIPTRGWVQK